MKWITAAMVAAFSLLDVARAEVTAFYPHKIRVEGQVCFNDEPCQPMYSLYDCSQHVWVINGQEIVRPPFQEGDHIATLCSAAQLGGNDWP